MKLKSIYLCGQHKDFCESISMDILVKKKLTFDGYLQTIVMEHIPIDEIGLLILCRMYHLQSCVLFKNHYWCALNGANVQNSKIVVAFRGKLRFSDMRKCAQNTKSEQYHLHTHTSLETQVPSKGKDAFT